VSVVINGVLQDWWASAGNNLDIIKALPADHSWSGVTTSMTAGATTALWDLVYFEAATGDCVLAKGDAAATMPCRAMATAAITDTVVGSYLLKGFARDDTWAWTIGAPLYVSHTTAGALTETVPTGTGKVVQIVGYAVSATIIYFSPDVTFIELA
jgi:hypothetical protein